MNTSPSTVLAFFTLILGQMTGEPTMVRMSKAGEAPPPPYQRGFLRSEGLEEASKSRAARAQAAIDLLHDRISNALFSSSNVYTSLVRAWVDLEGKTESTSLAFDLGIRVDGTPLKVRVALQRRLSERESLLLGIILKSFAGPDRPISEEEFARYIPEGKELRASALQTLLEIASLKRSDFPHGIASRPKLGAAWQPQPVLEKTIIKALESGPTRDMPRVRMARELLLSKRPLRAGSYPQAFQVLSAFAPQDLNGLKLEPGHQLLIWTSRPLSNAQAELLVGFFGTLGLKVREF